MALANTAWILAANGYRVLMIDWDLEAPGLHRYVRPLLADPDLVETHGLIDFFWDFSEAARLAAARTKRIKEGHTWFQPFTDLLRFGCGLNYDFSPERSLEFKGEGRIDLVPAGRQGPTYAARVAAFNWSEFYEKLGGGTFLEHVKKRLKAEYDYILIDSRTGLSDTAGICTVQMPDQLLVFFTLNRQSILGAAAVADSVSEQRRRPNGEPDLKIWPIPTRLDQAEIERLEAARGLARQAFAAQLGHLTKLERTQYWNRMQVPYVPYYAYEEVLSSLRVHSASSDSMLNAMEKIAGLVAAADATLSLRLPPMRSYEDELDRAALLNAYEGTRRSQPGGSGISRKTNRGEIKPRIFISYTKRDGRPEIPDRIAEVLDGQLGLETYWDEHLAPGEAWAATLATELTRSSLLICLVGEAWLKSQNTRRELAFARRAGLPVIFISLSPHIGVDSVSLQQHDSFLSIGSPPRIDFELRERLPLETLRLLRSQKPKHIDPDDTQRGLWGGKSTANGREMQASVKALSASWFEVSLTVVSTTKSKLSGSVTFFLHDTFRDPVREIRVRGGKATLVVHAYGAFTVGALADEGETMLELNLATLSAAPKAFRER